MEECEIVTAAPTAPIREIKEMFDGSVVKLLIRLGLPVLGGMAAQLLYTIVDTIWISRINLQDPSYVGGVGLVYPVLFMALAIANGLMAGISSLVARSIGKKDHQTLNDAAGCGLLIAVFLAGLLMLVFYLFGNSIVRLLGNDPEYIKHALEYMYYVIPSGIPMFVGFVLMGILQGEGLMKPLMISMVIGTAGNLILDPVFIFFLGMHIPGAALATVLSQVLATLYLVWVFITNQSAVRLYWKAMKIKLSVMREIVVIGLPQTAGQIMLSFSFIIFNTFIIKLDPYAFTAYTICGRLEQPVLLPIFAISAALVTMLGQNYGRKNYARLEKIWKTSLVIAMGLTTVIAAVFMLFAPQIYPFFTAVPEVIAFAVQQTRVIYLSLVFAAVTVLAASYFQAIGKPLPAFSIHLLRLAGFSVPALMLFVLVVKWGVLGVWLSAVTANILAGIFSFLLIRKDIKRQKLSGC